MYFVSQLTTVTMRRQSQYPIILLFNLLLSGILLISSYLLWQVASDWYAIPVLGILALMVYAHFIWNRHIQSHKQQQLALSQQQQHELMLQTINSGLFLLDDQLKISNQHSNYLQKLFGPTPLSGKHLMEVLSPTIDQNEIKTLHLFLQQLFNNNIPDSLLQELNPMSQIDLHITHPNNQTTFHGLNFQFTRIYDQQRITYVLVNINDIAHQNQAYPYSQNHELHTHFLLSLIQTDAPTITQLNAQLQNHVHVLSELLTQEQEHSDAYKLLLPHLSSHSQALQQLAKHHRLNMVSHWLDEFDSQLQVLKKQSYLSQHNFQPLLHTVSHLRQIQEAIDQVQMRLSQVQTQTNVLTSAQLSTSSHFDAKPKDHDDFQAWAHNLACFAQQHNKDIHLTYNTDDFQNLPLQLTDALQGYMWYLLQHAIMYGIETMPARIQQGKKPQGQINLTFTETPEQYCLSIKNDGTGIDFDAITAHAISIGWLPEESVIQPSRNQLLHYLQEPEFSDLSVIHEMPFDKKDLYGLRKWINEQGGDMQIETQTHRHTHITINIPKP